MFELHLFYNIKLLDASQDYLRTIQEINSKMVALEEDMKAAIAESDESKKQEIDQKQQILFSTTIPNVCKRGGKKNSY